MKEAQATLDAVHAASKFIRSVGFAVTVFNPDELNGAPPRQVEEAMCSAGYEAIETLGEP